MVGMDNPRRQPQALHGLRVLDISTFLAGPYCGAMLADFGAEVIKVELPGSGDPVRKLGVQYEGNSFYWRTVSRNKKTITLDLRRERGQEILRTLADTADVIIENFRPGTLDRWNIGFETLRSNNPGLIMVSITGFGQFGPKRDDPAVARTAMAFGGLTNLVGEAGGRPLLPGVAGLADYLGGIYSAYGVMVALHHREATGQGQRVDTALYEAIFQLLEDNLEVYDKLGEVKAKQGSANPNAAPHNHMLAADGKWVAIACSSDALYVRLCEAIGRPELASDPRFVTNAQRVENREAIEEIVEDWAQAHPASEVVKILSEASVPCCQVYDISDIVNDEHYREREAIVQVQTEDADTLAMRGVVPRLTETPGSVMSAGGSVGRDNQEVYSNLLGLTSIELENMKAEGII